MRYRLTGLIAGTLAAISVSTASAQCRVIDFDDVSPNTVINNFYSGVSFSSFGACGGDVRTSDFYTAPSGSNTATPISAAPCEFSPNGLRMIFDNTQRYVRMHVIGSSTIFVRAYSTTSGTGGLVSSQTITGAFDGARIVEIGALTTTAAANIVRVEVAAPGDFFEAIDQLWFDWDPTGPDVYMTEPLPGTCVCPGDTFSVRGVACDPDGGYQGDRLEYKRVDADPVDPWTLLGSFSSPLCTEGTLYTVSTASLDGPGSYFIRLTSTNACNVSNTAITTIRVDGSAPGVRIDRPTPNQLVCGELDVCGVVSDACAMDWTATVTRPNGSIVTIADQSGGASGIIATWPTDGEADGTYTLVVKAVDECGLETTRTVDFIINETACNECSADLDGNGTVGFEDLVMLLAAWGSMP